MSQVVIGMDPHKRSATIEVMAGDETVAGRGRYTTGAAGYRSMLAVAGADVGDRGMPGHRQAHR
jgi:transposase